MFQHKPFMPVLWAVAATTLAGCAAPAATGRGGDSLSAYNLSPEERRLQEVENKLTLVQRRLDALNTLRFDDENLRLRDDMRALRGDVEKLRYDLQQFDARSKNLYGDLDRRLQALEGRGSAAPATTSSYTPPAAAPFTPAPVQAAGGSTFSAPPAAAPAVGAAVSTADVASPEEEGAYLASFDLLKSGKYDEAVRGFRGVLDKWPRGRYSDNAAYWMGEASYVKRDYSSALAAFQTVVNNFPNSPKVADAALKVGLTQIELKQDSAARATLETVVRRYPGSNAAKLAQQKLTSMGGSADSGGEPPRR
jgi:tol-pal system protein YbgF